MWNGVVIWKIGVTAGVLWFRERSMIENLSPAKGLTGLHKRQPHLVTAGELLGCVTVYKDIYQDTLKYADLNTVRSAKFKRATLSLMQEVCQV